MNYFYRNFCSTCLAGVWMLILAASAAHGQNFAGTVTAEGDPDQAAREINNPLTFEPGAASSSARDAAMSAGTKDWP